MWQNKGHIVSAVENDGPFTRIHDIRKWYSMCKTLLYVTRSHSLKGSTTQVVLMSPNIQKLMIPYYPKQEMIALPVSVPCCLVKVMVHNDNLRVLNNILYIAITALG